MASSTRKSQSPTITPEQSAAARTQRAEKERIRRAEIKAAKEAMKVAKMDPKAELTTEQRKRAANYKDGHAGLSGDALARYILDGTNSVDQVKAAREERAAEQKASGTATRVRTHADPEAAELAVKAKALAPEVKSAFLPKDAREAIDLFSVKASGTKILIKRSGAQGVEGALEQATFERAALEAFAMGGQKDGDVRKILAQLGKGTRLWGRKLGLMLLARVA